jgi:hypothetical protein
MARPATPTRTSPNRSDSAMTPVQKDLRSLENLQQNRNKLYKEFEDEFDKLKFTKRAEPPKVAALPVEERGNTWMYSQLLEESSTGPVVSRDQLKADAIEALACVKQAEHALQRQSNIFQTSYPGVRSWRKERPNYTIVRLETDKSTFVYTYSLGMLGRYFKHRISCSYLAAKPQ